MSRVIAVAAAAAILSDLIAGDADYGSNPPGSLRELGQVLAQAIQAVPDLSLSAPAPSRPTWPPSCRSARRRVVLAGLGLPVTLGEAFEHLFDVRAITWGCLVVVAHGRSFAVGSPEASRVSNTIPTSGRADSDAGAAFCAGGGVGSFINGSSACRARSPLPA